MISIEVFLTVITLFFVRDWLNKSNKKPNNYDKGYRDAMSDVADKWNESNKNNLTDREHLRVMRDYIQKKLE